MVMARGGKDARGAKHEPFWSTSLIKEAKKRDIHVGSILMATYEEFIGVAPVRKE